MLPSVVVSIMLMLIAALASATLGAKDIAATNRLALRQQAQSVVAQAATDFLRQTGSLPTTLAQLASTPGYEHTRPYATGPKAVAYALSKPFSGSYAGAMPGYRATYRQAAVVSLNDTALSANTYLDADHNKCASAGAGSFVDKATWCGDSLGALFVVLSEREGTGADEPLASALQQNTADKLRVRYDALAATADKNDAYPVASGAVLLKAVAVPVSGTTSYAGANARECSGTFTWTPAPTERQGIPLDCGDLYNYFGDPVAYQRVSVTQMMLTSNSRYFSADGVTLNVITTRSP